MYIYICIYKYVPYAIQPLIVCVGIVNEQIRGIYLIRQYENLNEANTINPPLDYYNTGGICLLREKTKSHGYC